MGVFAYPDQPHMSNVRVRFAPSPTGFFHIGSARTALFNWLYARHTGGTFVLRIEDTDLERNKDEYLQVLFDSLKWLGFNWDEGPGVGGDYGPYFQSQRNDIYQQYLEKLRQTGRVYEKEGATWFKVSGQKQVIHDLIRGDVERLEEKDFVIIRSNGAPVFHFVNVVDDIAMKITHIIRGEDHLSNTSKHVELYEAFGCGTPLFAHIPLILKTDGPGKMSKRDRGALIEEYIQRHFLPEAVRNYLCLLGWSPKDDREILPIEEIVQLFDLPGVNRNNARFDEKKMAFVNTEYVRHMPPEAYLKKGKDVLQRAGILTTLVDDAYVSNVLNVCHEKVRSFEELPHFVAHFFNEQFDIDPAAKEKIFQKGEPKARLAEFSQWLQQAHDVGAAYVEQAVKTLAETHNVTTGAYIHAARLALSGSSVGPSFYHMVEVLGKERALSRIERFLTLS